MDNNICLNQNEFPSFSSIINKLTHHLRQDYTSKSLATQLDRAKSILDCERKTFLKKSLMLNIIREQAYIAKDDKVEVIREVLAHNNLNKMVRVNHGNKIVNVGCVTKEDLVDVCDLKPIKDVIKPIIEKEVQNLNAKVKHFGQDGTCTTVFDKVHHNNHTKQMVCKIKKDIEGQALGYITKAGEVLSLYEQVISNKTTDQEKESHLERIKYLQAISANLLLMIENLEAKIYADTYTESNVKALKVIYHMLCDRKTDLQNERSSLQHSLDSYLSLGEEFTEHVQLYDELTSTLAAYRWVVQGLTESNQNIT